MSRNKGNQGNPYTLCYEAQLSRLPSCIHSHKKKNRHLKKAPCKVHCRTIFFKNLQQLKHDTYKKKERISKGMCYHCAGLAASNSCIHNGRREPAQTGQQTKALNSITLRTTGPWQLLGQRNAIVTGKKSILHLHQKLQYKALSTWCRDLLTTLEQTWACTAKAACPCHHRSWPKELQNHHSDQLRLKELTKGFKKRQYNKVWRNTSQN